MNREGTLAQLGYIWPALVICSATAALASTVVIAARSLAVLRARRSRHGEEEDRCHASDGENKEDCAVHRSLPSLSWVGSGAQAASRRN